MNNGFIVIWRKFEDTSFYKDSFAVHLALHLIMQANHEPRKFIFNRKEESLERGQLITGRKALSYQTRISESTITHKLKLFENIGFITRKVNNKFTIITVCNYGRYQNKKVKVEQRVIQQVNSQGTASEQQMNTNNNTNNITIKPLNKDSCTTHSPERTMSVETRFNLIWNQYPNKDGKKAAERHFNASVKTDQDWRDINQALDNYLKDDKVIRGYIKNGSTWFNNWKDWINGPMSRPKLTETQAGNIQSLTKLMEDIGNDKRCVPEGICAPNGGLPGDKV
jgi:hypothetical protein